MPISKLRLLSIGVFLVIFAIAGFVQYYLSLNKQIVSVGLLVLVAAWCIVFQHLSGHWIKKVDQILTYRCDPEAYIQKVRTLLHDHAAKNKGLYRLSMQLRICGGLIQSGKYEEAEAEIPPVPVSPDSAFTRQLAILYSSLLKRVYLNGNEIDKAAAEIEAIRSLLDLETLKPDYTASIRGYIAYSECLLAMKRGQYEGVEESLLRFFDTAETPLDRVNIQFHLGELYVHFHERETAKPCYQYVIEHGNKLYVVAQAREALAELEQM